MKISFKSSMRRLMGDRRGNVLMIMGFATIPMVFATGMAIDYSGAARLRTKLNAVADAAALAAVTTPMMSQTREAGALAAYTMFTSQASNIKGLEYTVTSPVITSTATVASYDYGAFKIVITQTNSTGINRTAVVSYKARSQNSFAGVLGMATLPISGSSTTNAKVAPNIDFYVLLDTSGSMAFPATSGGITQLRSLTGGCAFACHSTNDATARSKNGSYTDYYGVALSYGIPLRVDEARKAVQSMMAQATQTSANNNADYQAAMYTFAAADPRAPNSFKMLASLTDNLQYVSDRAAQAQTSLYYNNGCPTKGFCNNDADTGSSDAFVKMNALMRLPGNGTNVLGDRPQGIMFVITDGMRDEQRASGVPEIAFDTSWCAAVKAKGIRVAILYTEYLKMSMDGDAWSQANVVPYLSQVEPALQNCSSDGLYYKVTTDDDISTALNRLFSQAVSTARITQ
ncbi:Flp pilus assembly protein TadG [Sphingomonas sp. PP-CE-3A-406]|uniref:TadE/TadG family type IV pilus assembly protein n=1 Tax=Sphingomonas sp. PP-CE-3A-406 TaxID=2135659 RepID=UPI000EF8B25C|nr:pilus assembly protein TadG-related protein [Sphingomonas sp. PP-CE-3A-406]RMB55220.1 Flp pilus assembly protein TadG [Sphingomonas sp. PP-CE-3A-406]